MECNVACGHLSAWMDSELSPDEASLLEAHVASCAACRATLEALRSEDGDLRSAFAGSRQAAQRVAAAVLQELDREAPVVQVAPHWGRDWSRLLLAAAAGFLLAVVLFQPWKNAATPVQPPGTAEAGPHATEPVAARLVVATGGIEMRPREAPKWLLCPEPAGLTCATGSLIKTGPDARCELTTSDGCVIRLNRETEISLASPGKVEVRQGQIWCSAPENVSLTICAPARGGAAEKPVSSDWVAACNSNSSLITDVGKGGDVQVMTAGGETELQTPRESQRLKPGECASIVGGQIVKSPGRMDAVLAQSWIHPLLVRKGHGDKELADRVDQLLARMGQSKVTLLYEQEIRGLGEFAALPLLRYVQSPISVDEPSRRRMAMHILSDIAPSWMVPDLIGLLDDPSEEIRVRSAQTLLRLTGLDQNRPPEKWRDDPADCQPAIDRWQQWWQEHRHEYVRPAAASMPAAKDTVL